jgi:hypothetical protein
MAFLEDEDFLVGLCEVVSGDEAVMPSTDDNCVVSFLCLIHHIVVWAAFKFIYLGLNTKTFVT